MAAAEVLAWSPPASRFAGSKRLPRPPPPPGPAGGSPAVLPPGRGAGPVAAKDGHAGTPWSSGEEDGLHLLFELTNASKVTV